MSEKALSDHLEAKSLLSTFAFRPYGPRVVGGSELGRLRK
jgi:hypothetical protein